MKKTLIFILLALSFNIKSQNLEQYIPANSDAVLEISGDKLFQLISEEDIVSFVTSSIGPVIDVDALNNLGIDLRGKMYYTYSKLDDIISSRFICRILNIDKFNSTLQQQFPMTPELKQGYYQIKSGTRTLLWNDNILVVNMLDIPKVVYTMDDLLAEKALETPMEEEEMLIEMEDEPSEEIEIDIIDVDEAESSDVIEYTEEMMAVDSSYSEDYEDYYGEENYGDSEYEEQQMLEYELTMKNYMAPLIYSETQIDSLMDIQVESFFQSNEFNSISKNASFRKGRNDQSSLYFWLRDPNKMIFDKFLKESMPVGMYMGNQMPNWYQSISGNLIFDTEEMKLSLNMEVKDDLASKIEKMYKTIDKKYLKFFNADDIMAYMALSSDMEEFLKQYPSFLQDILGRKDSNFSEEVEVLGDLMSIFLDEEAISDLVTGDALMLFHDLDKFEVPFTSYEYDENFNMVEVERTKEEMLPSFTILIGSENKAFNDKLSKLVSKYLDTQNIGAIKRFATKSQTNFDMYYTQKNGMILLSNSLPRMTNYVNGNIKCNLGKNKDYLKKNIFTLYLNSSKMIDKGTDLFHMKSDFTDYLQQNYTDVILTAGKPKNNLIGYDLILKTNKQNGNSLKQIFTTYGKFQEYLRGY